MKIQDLMFVICWAGLVGVLVIGHNAGHTHYNAEVTIYTPNPYVEHNNNLNALDATGAIPFEADIPHDRPFLRAGAVHCPSLELITAQEGIIRLYGDELIQYGCDLSLLAKEVTLERDDGVYSLVRYGAARYYVFSNELTWSPTP